MLTCTLSTATVDETTRTITGTATFFGVVANASTGSVLFAPGSLELPEDLSRVKLCIEHEHSSAVGYAIDATADDTKLEMKFYVPEGPAGDEALASAAAGLRDGLSVGAYPKRGGAEFIHGEDYLHITAAALREVSLTTIPAFADAKVSHVAAQADTTPTLGEPMPTETPQAAVVEAAAEPTPIEAAAEPTPIEAAAAAPVVHTQTGLTTVRTAAEKIAQLFGMGARSGEILAALKDVVPANDKGEGFIGRAQWLGELWSASLVDRPLIDSITSKPLGRTTKVKGWRWKKKPEVGTYSGNKTAIPSNQVETEAIESAVKRIAGGWDIDRIYVDLGDPDMIEALFEAARDDYKLKTEADVTTSLLGEATKLTGSNALPAALVTLGAKAASQGSRLNFVSFGLDVWTAFTTLTKDEMPWWITSGDGLSLSTTSGEVNGLRLFANPSLPAGTILAGDKRAATYYETETPIRVNAIDLANGGIDLGLFGYHGLLVNDPTSLFKIEAAG